LQITKERKNQVRDLYFNQHKTYVEIAQIEKMSPRDIHAIVKGEEDRRQKYKDQQQRQEMSAKAYKLFSDGKRLVQVAIILNLREPQVTKYNREYWKLKGLDKLNTIHTETNGNIWPLWKLYQQLVMKKGMSIEQVVNGAEIGIHKLPHMETLYKQVEDEVNKLQYARQSLVNDIRTLERKISILDKTAFSIEQDCKRREQRVQELADKKDRLQKLIANIMNNDDEGYSMLKRIVKENVKTVLSDNRILVSASFAALIQTLKTDPQMVNIINSIPITANGSEQNKDNNNSITKYLESNKDRILNLVEKNYENLVEVLTNNAIDHAYSSSNSTLSLNSSSTTFSNPSNQSDNYRKEEPEDFHNSKGDIAE
jgi:hypothetical protein